MSKYLFDTLAGIDVSKFRKVVRPVSISITYVIATGCWRESDSERGSQIKAYASASSVGSVTIDRGCHLLILNENSLSNWPWAAFLSVLLNDDSCFKRAVCNGTNSTTVQPR